MHSNKKKKIKASSLYESVVAIAIISIAITMGTMVFFNVTNNVYNQVSYHQLFNKIDELKNKKNQVTLSFKGYNLVKTEKEINTLIYIEINAFKEKRLVLKKEYILKNE